MEQIKISLQEVSNCASIIRSHNTNMHDTLNYVSKLMHDLSLVWQSQSSQTIISRFENFRQKFIEENEIIESYANFLDQTVSTYDSLESTINSNAQSFN